MVSTVFIIIIVLLLLGLAIYAVQQIPLPGPSWVGGCIIALMVLVAIIVIAQKTGLAV